MFKHRIILMHKTLEQRYIDRLDFRESAKWATSFTTRWGLYPSFDGKELRVKAD